MSNYLAILNGTENRATNVSAESSDAKVIAFS